MYPTFSHLIQDIFGVYIPLPIQSFGLLVGIAFLVAGYALQLELKRKENDGLMKPFTKKEIVGKKAEFYELLLNGLFIGIVGYKLVEAVFNYSSLVDNPQEFILSTKGNIFGLIGGFIYGYYTKMKESEKEALPQPVEKSVTVHPHQLISNIVMIAAVAGLIGAKIFHNLEYPEEFFNDPIDALLSFSGLTMYGGLFFGAAAVLYYGHKNGIKPFHLMDAAAPALLIGYGIGRIGCHISGDGDWGIVNNSAKPGFLSFLPDWFFKYSYPNNVINEGIPIPGCEGKFCFMLPDPVYPTPLYEAIAAIALFFVLWSFRKKIKVPGMMFSIYLIVNGIERFLIEQIRVNAEYNLFGFHPTQAELIASGLILFGVFGIFYTKKAEGSKQII